MRPLWRDLILKVWGGDPLQCPCCPGTMKPVRTFLRREEIEFFLRLHGLWEGVIHLPRPPPPPFDIDTMEPIEPPWQAIKEWIPDDDPDLNWFNQERDPTGAEAARSLRPKSRLATSRSSSRRWPHLGPRRLLKGPCVRNQRKTAATKDLGNAGRVGTVWTKANRQQNPIDSPNNPKCVMDVPILGSSPFKIRPSEFLPAPLSPATPFLPHPTPAQRRSSRPFRQKQIPSSSDVAIGSFDSE